MWKSIASISYYSVLNSVFKLQPSKRRNRERNETHLATKATQNEGRNEKGKSERASSHSSLAPTVEIGGIWPPKGIGVLDPRQIPFLNIPILLSSGAAVTWAHHAILVGKLFHSKDG
ncbi:cytochrome C oxidase subunit 3 [Cucumis melo var. makuwa]|nr:cytochrome C oxidase subunit 3 [Cucumis melo var. makuwa]TYJ95762.1 cytochrome C oxidase subunit 3 [Cucumis melo var. makuwa]